MLRVLALASYPVEAAATRYRLVQFITPLMERGISLDVRPFLDQDLFAALYRRGGVDRKVAGIFRGAARRLGDVAAARVIDVLLVQREAMILGPPLFEWLMMRLGNCPMVLDLDDATYVSYRSPTYGRLGSVLKWPGKTDHLIRWATVVTCGNRTIAEYVGAKGAHAVVIPTVADTERFQPTPRPDGDDTPVVGWVGTHSTFPYLESIFPALQRVSKTHRFRLKIVGAGREQIRVPGVNVEALEWNMEREVQDFQSFDIGLYPIVADRWSAGKSGFKSIQYMAVGIPYVATPVGACSEIGEPGVTHLCATSTDEWCAALARLLSDEETRRRMGEAGRRYALQHFTVPAQAEKLANALHLARESFQHAMSRASAPPRQGISEADRFCQVDALTESR
jgi:glycosyltransferase involved in cell wall biosynthesis